jgi:hypothetical protein
MKKIGWPSGRSALAATDRALTQIPVIERTDEYLALAD